MKTSLILFSGLPGCGKTTLARRLAQTLQVPLFAKDRLQSRLRTLTLTVRSGAQGYHLILDLADEQLSLGVSAILDGVFPREGFRSLAREMAHRHGALFRAIFCYCSDVDLWKRRMDGRVQYVPDWSPVGWEEVERLQAEFEPWADERVLRVDAAAGLEENFRLAFEWINISS